MSSIIDPEPELPAAEELVAYLDGELPPEACRRVEERLAADASYRQQLRDLDQAWEALDALPATRADDDFARTTMELATVAAESELSTQTASAAAQRRRRLRLWAAIGTAAAILTFIAAWMLIPNGNKTLLDDLPVIRQVEWLAPIENVGFLRRLSTDVPIERLMHDEGAVDDEMAQIAGASADLLEARRQWIESLTTQQKANLAANARRFEELSRNPDEAERLRGLEREIGSANDAKRLQKTMLAYGQWLGQLSPGQQEQLRDDLQDLTTDEQRVDRIEKIVRREVAQTSHQLSPEDAENLRREVFEIAQEWRERNSRRQRERGGQWLREIEGSRGALMIVTLQLGDGDRRDEVRKRLESKLSSEARSHLDRLDRRGRWQLSRWIRDSLALKSGPEELERFFASDALDYQQREWLLSLSAEEMQTELERLYFGTQLGFGDDDREWNDFRRDGGGPWGPPGEFRPDMRRDGPPRDRDRPGGPPPPFDDRDRFERGPNGPRGPRPGGLPDGLRFPDRPPGPQPDGRNGPGELEPI